MVNVTHRTESSRKKNALMVQERKMKFMTNSMHKTPCRSMVVLIEAMPLNSTENYMQHLCTMSILYRTLNGKSFVMSSVAIPFFAQMHAHLDEGKNVHFNGIDVDGAMEYL